MEAMTKTRENRHRAAGGMGLSSGDSRLTAVSRIRETIVAEK
jgi:hypothetical protein